MHTMTPKNLFFLLLLFTSIILRSHAQLQIPIQLSLDNNLIFLANIGDCQGMKIQPILDQGYNDMYISKYFSCSVQTPSGNYAANVQINDFEAAVIFGYHTYEQTYYINFGLPAKGFEQLQFVTQLQQQGLISQKTVYFTLFDAFLQQLQVNKTLGQLMLDEPNPQYIKEGSSFVNVQTSNGLFNFISNGKIEFFDSVINISASYKIGVGLKFESFDMMFFDKVICDQIANILDAKNISVQRDGQYYFVFDIKRLESIQISLLAEDNTNFKLTLDPKQYTKEITKGYYQLLFTPSKQTNTITLSYRWNLSTFKTFLAERVSVLNPSSAVQGDQIAFTI